MKVNFLFCVMIKVLKYPLLSVYSYIQREVYKGLSLRAMRNPLTPEWLVLCTMYFVYSFTHSCSKSSMSCYILAKLLFPPNILLIVAVGGLGYGDWSTM